MNRQEARKFFLALRQEQTVLFPQRRQQLMEQLSNWLEKQPCRVVGFYCAFRAEPDLWPLLVQWQARGQGRIAALPVIDDKTAGTMHYAQYCETDGLSPGLFGIDVPRRDCPVVPDIILSPCVAFSSAGYRLGNGGGYFDRYVAERERSGAALLTVAVAYDALRYEAFEPLGHDRPFDWIATQSGVRQSASGSI